MKTGKKILAVLLVFCFVLTAVPAFAADFTHTLTNKVYNELWERWDATASIPDLTVTVEIEFNGAPLTFEDATIQNMLKNNELNKAGCSITIPEYTLGEGENAYTMPARKAEIKTNYGLWITYLLPTNGEVATAMVEESKTNTELQALLTMDETTGAASLETDGNVYGNNLVAFLKYKTNGAPLKATVKATLHAGGTFEANGDFPLTSFFISDEKINTFAGGETPWIGSYQLNNSSSKGLYASALQDSSLDGPYTVFTAPATGVYDVFASKRDGSTNSGKSMRHIALDIAGETYEFSNTQAPDTIEDYYWEPATGSKAVSLTKGQQVAIRILAETGSYAGCYGIAFVPRTEAETPVTLEKFAVPKESGALESASIATSVPAAETATVTVDGEEVVITAGAAEAYYPNVRKSDANGNYINKPTLLDALVTLDKQEDIGISAQPISSNGKLITGNSDSLVVSADTAQKLDVEWPTNSNGNGYREIWQGTEIYCSDVSRTITATVYVPEAGNYHFVVSGYVSGSRYMNASVDGKKFYADAEQTVEKILTNSSTKVHKAQSANGYALEAGYHDLSITFSNGWIRMNYAALVKADSQEEAAEIQAGFTTKEALAAYSNYNQRAVFDGNAIPDFDVAVNDELITENFDRYILSDGDEIRLDVFEPISLKGKINAVSGNIGYHTNRWLSDETLAVSDYVVTMSSDQIAALNKVLPVDVTEKDSMRGMYLNGYLGFIADDADTDGDETLVNNYICYEIKGNSQCAHVTKNEDGSESVCNRLVIAIDAITKNSVNVTFDGKTYKNIYGSFNEAYHKNYDWTNFYLTDNRFNGDATVKAEYADGKVVISSKKAQPIFVIVKNADGSKASATNYSLMFDTSIEVPVEAGQTVYVWGGTQYKVNGTTALPLCAPVTAPSAE